MTIAVDLGRKATTKQTNAFQFIGHIKNHIEINNIKFVRVLPDLVVYLPT